MNTYALSNCLARSPEPFVSYKRARIERSPPTSHFSGGKYLYKKIDFARLISKRQNFHELCIFFCKHSLSLWLNEFCWNLQYVSTGHSY